MQRGTFYYEAQRKKERKKMLTQAVAGTNVQHKCSSSCVVPSEEADAATVSQHAISTCCSTASQENGSKARVRVGAPPSPAEDGCCGCSVASGLPWLAPGEANGFALPNEA